MPDVKVVLWVSLFNGLKIPINIPSQAVFGGRNLSSSNAGPGVTVVLWDA
jgi:hypothetical protein